MIPRKVSLYWVCQLLGWGSVAIYWSYYQITWSDPTFGQSLSVLLPFTAAIGYTHLYRNLAHSQDWINYSIKKLTPIIIAAWLSISIIYIAIAMLNIKLIQPGAFDFDGILGVITGGTRYSAIWLLAFHLYHFSQYRLRHELAQMKGEMLHLEAQYQNLNTELNPHFLFNALNSIKALTIENPARSRKAIDLLSDILRQSLQVSKYLKTTLSSEMVRVRSYLELEQMRFEERLSFNIEIDPSVTNSLLPPLSLFNLVENAVKHGIEQYSSTGLIQVHCSASSEHLIIKVTNTGSLGEPNAAGIGLKNTKERLKILYRSNASLALKQLQKNQVQATLSLPLEYEKEKLHHS